MSSVEKRKDHWKIRPTIVSSESCGHLVALPCKCIWPGVSHSIDVWSGRQQPCVALHIIIRRIFVSHCLDECCEWVRVFLQREGKEFCGYTTLDSLFRLFCLRVNWLELWAQALKISKVVGHWNVNSKEVERSSAAPGLSFWSLKLNLKLVCKPRWWNWNR